MGWAIRPNTRAAANPRHCRALNRFDWTQGQSCFRRTHAGSSVRSQRSRPEVTTPPTSINVCPRQTFRSFTQLLPFTRRIQLECSVPPLRANPVKHRTKTDRRVAADRRAKTRSGRRADDPAPALHCRTCGGEDIAVVVLSAVERMLQCRNCRCTWFARARRR